MEHRTQYNNREEEMMTSQKLNWWNFGSGWYIQIEEDDFPWLKKKNSQMMKIGDEI